MPLGIGIGYLIIRIWWKKNLSLKKITLLFALFLFILSNYLIPPVPSGKIKETIAVNQLQNEFRSIDYESSYSPRSSIQEKIKKYGASDEILMFRNYVFQDKGIAVKNDDWFQRFSIRELDYYWASIGTEGAKKALGKWQVYYRFNRTGEEYIGFFGETEGQPYLKYVIKGKVKDNSSYIGFF
ncbi:hypothetical protein [Bacillus sp. 1P06AnD]|uniref:hypothetical protein n=1 Tax=Bacillus sp. 1P06AnD TaxID=3132208 RepID=UPI0039A317DD